MRGKVRPISIPRRFIVDMMRASKEVPFVSLSRPLAIAALLDARGKNLQQPGWAAIFVKAFSLVARDEPVLRTLYIDSPFPHFYELPRNIGMVAVSRAVDGETCVLPQKVPDADLTPLGDVDALVRHAKTAAIEDIPAFHKVLRITRLPLPLRRLVWWFGLTVGRQRANYFGSFGITSVSAMGKGELHAISPGPFVVTYGVVNPDRTIDVVIRWDHRVTDAAVIARTLSRLEQVLNGEIAAELRAASTLPELKAVRAAAT